MHYTENAFSLLPDGLVDKSAPKLCGTAEEIRLRLGRAPTVLSAGREQPQSKHCVSERDINCVLERATGASFHSHIDELREGYIFTRGLRIGVCGAAAVHSGEVSAFRRVTSLNIRIPHEFSGNMDAAYNELTRVPGKSVLIISPPGGGKTTALRELIRRLSDSGANISVADERGELAADDGAGAAFDLGSRTDVLTGVRKSRAVLMLLRAMNPRYIAVDEITDSADIAAMREISGCGVALLATAHADSAEKLSRRALYRTLLAEKLFDYALEIHLCDGKRTYICRSLN